MGSFVLYLLGYLSLRFHLTSRGIETDLMVIDERYLFEGARFLAYLMTSIPSLILLVLVPLVPLYLVGKLIPGRRLRRFFSEGWERRCTANRLAMAGIVASVVMIQLVMRQCFLMDNLLLRGSLPSPEWLRSLLLGESVLGALYFSGILAATLAVAGLYLLARRWGGETPRSRFMIGLLLLLVVVQAGLLPVNYGILVAGHSVPRVAHLGDPGTPLEGRDAWLIWERPDSLTFLVRDRETRSADPASAGPEGGSGQPGRSLLTLKREAVQEVEVTCYDPILRILFLDEASPCT